MPRRNTVYWLRNLPHGPVVDMPAVNIFASILKPFCR